MKLKYFLAANAAYVICAAAIPASAAPLQFTFAGPSGSASFQLDSNPKPDFSSSFLGSDQFGFNNVAGTFGGKAGIASVISFGDGIFSSLSITAPNLGFTQFSSPTLFTGAPGAPTFDTGSFTLINPFFGNGTLTISPLVASVPEPASWAIVMGGLGVAGLVGRRRDRRQGTSNRTA